MQDLFDLNALQERAAALVEAAQNAGADAADSVVAAGRSTGVEIRDNLVEETESAENNTFSLRAFVGNRSASVSANLMGDPAALADRVVAMAKVSPEDPYGGLAPKDRLATIVPDLDLLDYTALDFETMSDCARSCEAAALGVKGVTKSSGASFGHSLGGSVLATSEGFLGSYQASRFSLSVSVVGGQGSKMERDYDFDSQRYLSDLRAADNIGSKAGERAVARLNPQRVATQTTTVVFAPRMARGLLSHLAGAINGSSIVRKTSFLRDDLGKPVFSPDITVIDEPHLIRGASSRPFDGEGIAGEDLKLIENGVLNTWLLDTATARELNLQTNARANRAGSSTSPGSTNLTLLPGKISVKDMLGQITSGFYVTELIGQGVNLVSGDYSRGASGFWIENGELTFAVSEVTIAGDLREMFKQLYAADDLDKRYGTNAPTLAIEGMTIAGK